jgi:hypothetical protein
MILFFLWSIFFLFIVNTSCIIQNLRKSEKRIRNPNTSDSEWSDFTQRVHSELYRLQFPDTVSSPPLPSSTSSFCNDPNRSFLVLEFGNEEQINGFAAIFQFAASAMAIAHALNRTLVEILPSKNLPMNHQHADFIQQSTRYISLANQRRNDPWTRAPAAVCGGRKLSCFFESISACAFYPSIYSPIHKIPLLDASSISSAIAQGLVRILRINSISDSRPLVMAATRGNLAPNWAKEYSSCNVNTDTFSTTRSFSSCQVPRWFPAIQSFMFKPLFRIRQLLGEDVIKSMWKTGIPSFGVHIRRGDAVMLDWRSHATAKEYIDALLPLKNSLIKVEENVRIDHSSISLSGKSLYNVSFPLYIATDSIGARQRAMSYAKIVGNLQPLSSPALLLLYPKEGKNSTYDASKDLSDEVHINTEQFLRTFLSYTPLLPSLDDEKREESGFSEADFDSIHEYNHSMYEDFADSLFQWTARTGTGSKDSERLLHHLSNAQSTRDMTDGVIADILALSHAAFFVGTCFSQVSRLASEIRAARATQVFQDYFARVASYPQFVALDSTQCRAFSQHSYTISIDWRMMFDTRENESE